MAAAIQITLDELGDFFAKYADKLNRMDWQPTVDRLKIMTVRWAKKCFDEGKDPQGKQWLPLKYDRTTHGRHQAKADAKPLRDTGMLMMSLAARGQPLADGFEVAWGSNLEYAGVHNYGHVLDVPDRRRTMAEKPWSWMYKGKRIFTRHIKAHTKTIPKRQFLGVNDENKDDIRQLLREEFLRQFGAPMP